jgi:ketosteroid isomerase-like protein
MVRRMLLATVALALFALPVRAQSDDRVAVEKIKENEAQWGAAMVRQDWATIERMVAPEFVATDGAGKRTDRAAYMAMLQTGGMSFSNLQLGPEQVIVNGNTAIHAGEATMTVKMPDGTTGKYHVVWTDTWVKDKDGKWLCIASQAVEHPIS